MRYSTYLIPTLKEPPKEAEFISHSLLLRAGFIRKLAAGIYNYLPMGLRVLNKVKAIIRQAHNQVGALEILMPFVCPAELWQETGRWENFGPELLRFKDRKGADFCIGPTHEEIVTDLVRREVRSYKELPVILYQIQTKFRDEPRPRAGLIRGREFMMKDAYSFDKDEAAARESYQKMVGVYHQIFGRIGFDYRSVEADTGAIGGTLSHEFQVLVASGEDSIVACTQCGYAANVEKAEIKVALTSSADEARWAPLEKVHTPEKRTIKEVSEFLKVGTEKLVKTIIYLADQQPIAALISGEKEINEVKLKGQLKCRELVPADAETIKRVTQAEVGFAGPIGLNVPMYVDPSVLNLENFVVGANELDHHYINVNIPRDFGVKNCLDIKIAAEGDLCGKCGHSFKHYRGIEVGHTFYLGTKYSQAMKANFSNESKGEEPFIMGCYGIGVSRIVAAAVEQSHDEKGIIWPQAIAPFQVEIISVSQTNSAVLDLAEDLYQRLLERQVEVLFDDREERPGIKFNDADLIGIPLQVIVGEKGLKEGVVEVKVRQGHQKTKVPATEIFSYIIERIN